MLARAGRLFICGLQVPWIRAAACLYRALSFKAGAALPLIRL
ncbi:hypothetical protein [Paraburkholderia caffeinilytica]|nr:hypothetical protein [Paraburkholderia caffeinilytica]